MGRGSKHSKNAGGMGTEGLTYHERKALGYGTLKERLGKDAQGNFYDCCLTLQPATDPMVTSQGYIFSKEAILDYFLTQKELKKKELKEWEQQQQAEVDLVSKAAQIEEAAKLELFERQNIAGASDRATEQAKAAVEQSKEELRAPSQGEASGFTVKVNEKRAKETKHTPSSNLMATKPSMHVLCPVTSKKLRMKDLTPVKFTPANDGATNSFMDPVSNDTLNNSSALVAIKATGDVMLEKTYKTCIKPDGIYKGCKIAEKDVIKLMTGGSGFAGGKQSDKLQSDKKFLLGPGSGKADLRGQAAGGASRFGLSFMN